jgi:hypothetical protein
VKSRLNLPISLRSSGSIIVRQEKREWPARRTRHFLRWSSEAARLFPLPRRHSAAITTDSEEHGMLRFTSHLLAFHPLEESGRAETWVSLSATPPAEASLPTRVSTAAVSAIAISAPTHTQKLYGDFTNLSRIAALTGHTPQYMWARWKTPASGNLYPVFLLVAACWVHRRAT